MVRKAFTFESNLNKIIPKIEAAPEKVLGIVGNNLVKEIKATTLKTQFHQRYKILARSTKNTGLQWAYGYDSAAGKKDKTSLQIGFKMSIPGIVGKMMTGEEADPLKPVVVKNAEVIQDMLRVAMNEIGRKT